jgi:hypothetical protein
LLCLQEEVQQKCPKKWRTRNLFLHRNTSAHSTLSVPEFLAKHVMTAPSVLPISSIMWLPSFYKTQVGIEDWADLMASSQFRNNCSLHLQVWNAGLPQMLETFAQLLDSLHQITREVLQRVNAVVTEKNIVTCLWLWDE